MLIMKGQSSMELLTTFGLVLAFTLPVLFLVYSLTSVGSEDTSKSQADATARSLADSMNLVYSQGNGTSRNVLLNVPASTESIRFSSNEVVVRIKTSQGYFDASSPTFARVIAPRPITGKTGLVLVKIANVDNSLELSIQNEE